MKVCRFLSPCFDLLSEQMSSSNAALAEEMLAALADVQVDCVFVCLHVCQSVCVFMCVWMDGVFVAVHKKQKGMVGKCIHLYWLADMCFYFPVLCVACVCVFTSVCVYVSDREKDTADRKETAHAEGVLTMQHA